VHPAHNPFSSKRPRSLPHLIVDDDPRARGAGRAMLSRNLTRIVGESHGPYCRGLIPPRKSGLEFSRQADVPASMAAGVSPNFRRIAGRVIFVTAHYKCAV